MRKIAYAVALSLLLASPAAAACFGNIGCTDEDRFDEDDLSDLKCSKLWEIRNTIYYEAGYCFKTRKAIKFFGNDECEYDDAEDLSFSRIEQHNIDAIVSVEDDKGC